MIYLRLHQAKNEEVDTGGNRSKHEQLGKFRYYSEIFAMYNNFVT